MRSLSLHELRISPYACSFQIKLSIAPRDNVCVLFTAETLSPGKVLLQGLVWAAGVFRHCQQLSKFLNATHVAQGCQAEG